MKKEPSKKKERKKKGHGRLHYLNLKNLQTEIYGYGYQYSLKNFLLTLIVSFVAIGFIGYFFLLDGKYIAALLVLFGITLPTIIVDQFRFLYEQKRFRDTVDYLEQMIYSFKKKPKILVSLQDVLLLSDGEMKKCVEKAIADIQAGVGYEKALRGIEEEYGCDRMRILHDFMIKVEMQGGKYQSTLNVILNDIQSWTERTYSFQKDRSHIKMTIMISIIMSAIISATTVVLLKNNKDMSSILTTPIYQISTTLVLGALICVFSFAQKKLTGSWLVYTEEEDHKRIDRDWNALKNPPTRMKKFINTLIVMVICLPVIGIGVYMHNKLFLVIGCILEIMVVTVPTRSGNSAKSRLTKLCEKEFPVWIRGIALDLQTDNVYISLQNSISMAPYVFREELVKLVDAIEKDPTSILPYQHFLEDLEVPEIHSIVKMLYSFTNLGNEDAEGQINSLITRNNLLIEKSERLKDADKVKMVKQITWLPMMLAIGKIFVDMGMLIMHLFGTLSKMS